MTRTSNLRDVLISAEDAILDQGAAIIKALEVLERGDAKIALIVDEKQKLIGSLTDGDIRRGLLEGHALNAPVYGIMHATPHYLPATATRSQILDLMQHLGIQQVPLLRKDGSIAGIAVFSRLVGMTAPRRSNRVVIMAGGKGKRLMPITTDIPKPMVEVGGRPILEWIIQRFIADGFHEFTLAINYLGHIIEAHFGDGKRLNCSINYIREQTFMGTAGALSMLDTSITEPLILINGDILASVDFADLMDYHLASGASATVCVRTHRSEVPYGVIHTQDGLLTQITEKPVYEDLVSAGIYVINPDVLRHIPSNTVTDMPTVLLSLVKNKQHVTVYAIQDEWIDVGRHKDLERARLSFTPNAS